MRRWSSGAAPGIACIVAAMLMLSLQDSIVKWLGATYALHQIVLIRSVIAAVLTLIVLAAMARLHSLRTRRWSLHLARGGLLLVTNTAFFLALVAMPIAEAVAMFFVAPLFITVLSALLLREPVGPRRLFAVLMGFAGVVIVVRPGSGLFGYVALLPVGAAATYAVMQILTRRLGTTDSAATMAFYIQLTFIIAGLSMGLAVGDGRYAGGDDPSLNFLLRSWRLPAEGDVPLFGLVGLLIAAASVLMSQAYRVTEAATIAPFEYIALPIAAVWGFLFWGDVPDAIAILGMGLIVGSGVFIVVRTERLRSGESIAAKPLATIDEQSGRSG
jgi:drug/metabolite transporter (DMT)-like permease